MRSFVKVFPAIIWIVINICGCAPQRCSPSLIHPHQDGKPFQECAVDLSFYKQVQQRSGQDANIVFVVAVSGGGFRASNFATGAMLGLEELKKMLIHLHVTPCRRPTIFQAHRAVASL
jgi:hypothetical protein